jgi:hypothetical protein
MLRSSKSKSGKKRLLPPSKTQFAWAMERRADAKTYFHSLSGEWDSLGPDHAKREALAAEAAALAAAQAAAGQVGSANPAKPHSPAGQAARSTMLKPTPTQRMVRAPSHMVFRTKIVTRGPNNPK